MRHTVIHAAIKQRILRKCRKPCAGKLLQCFTRTAATLEAVLSSRLTNPTNATVGQESPPRSTPAIRAIVVELHFGNCIFDNQSAFTAHVILHSSYTEAINQSQRARSQTLVGWTWEDEERLENNGTISMNDSVATSKIVIQNSLPLL